MDKLPVTHDTTEYEVVINGVKCIWCERAQDPEFCNTYLPGMIDPVCDDCIEAYKD